MKIHEFGRIGRVVKGFANRRRIQMLDLLSREAGLTIEQIAQKLDLGYMNASDHVRRMALGGLVAKRHEGPRIFHTLTERGKIILSFCKKL
jgi:DNA-binding transcriptional ArsR family regulator